MDIESLLIDWQPEATPLGGCRQEQGRKKIKNRKLIENKKEMLNMREVKEFSKQEERWLRKHKKPEQIQQVLNALEYRDESIHVPAICALRDKKAHCFDGALLAAAILRRAEIQPYIIDLCAVGDDDHLLCAFRIKGHWGAVAKSNFPGLRFREPIFRSPRELVLSYFEFYFSLDGKKSLRRFSLPVKLPALSRMNWECERTACNQFLRLLEKAPHRSILTRTQAQNLARLDSRLFQSQMLGVSLKGAYGGDKFKKRL